ncbi:MULTISPECIES: hypothetical protein [unclassified Bacillus (in: firmicutes)]|uniref:hypothetical protein n=1 Tax=unclassified Bacillus (in: firmicutes) TaxID=185979 RepID=UPI001BE80046|nr:MULTISPECIES: hypothetical protein [unclassified Bacillus (in: firmicutes)]MBT2640391.1 hypothetical protein [Bacillus sp. ISL-39]MBT2663323.1 hypothetical protein [Bacillus sp. ISL-45]
MKKYIGLLILVLLILNACSNSDEPYWGLSATFTKDGKHLSGTEDQFGMTKMNGETDEPEFPAGKGRHYKLYFLDNSKDLTGKKYKMIGTHKDSGKSRELYQQEIMSMQSEAKFGFDEKGLWKIDIFIDDEEYSSFVVEAR